MEPMTPAKVVLIFGCAYEIVALLTPGIPTITEMVYVAKDHSFLGRVLVWAAAGGAMWHFFVEEA